MRRPLVFLFFILTSSFAFGQQTFDAFCNDFVAGYTKLHLPQLELSYVSGLERIGTAADVQKQLDFFTKVKTGLSAFKADQLSESEKVDYQLIRYETGLNLERIALEQDWLKNKPAAVPTNGIINLPNGKACMPTCLNAGPVPAPLLMRSTSLALAKWPAFKSISKLSASKPG